MSGREELKKGGGRSLKKGEKELKMVEGGGKELKWRGEGGIKSGGEGRVVEEGDMRMAWEKKLQNLVEE